jgi:hypothetical protein
MTRRERKERKAERLREWAEKRRAKSDAALGQFRQIADMIPPGQPILVDHYSARPMRRALERKDRAFGASVEHARKADNFESRAAGIDAQNDKSIYSDDPDAPERLRERIAELEARNARIKAYNTSCRKGQPDTSLLDDDQRKDLAVIVRVCAYQLRAGGQFPAYTTSNVNNNIKRLRDRLSQIEGTK